MEIIFEGMHDQMIYGAARGGGMSLTLQRLAIQTLPKTYLLFFKVNGKRVSVDVRDKTPLHKVVRFVGNSCSVPDRLVKFEKASIGFGWGDLIYHGG